VIEHIRFMDVFIDEKNRVFKVSGIFVVTAPMHNIINKLLISITNFEIHFNPEIFILGLI
jgi:hypothetical protein